MYFEQFYLGCLSHVSYMLGQHRLAIVKLSKPVAVHCKGAGFEQIMNLRGGFDAWLACKLPYVAAEQAAATP